MTGRPCERCGNADIENTNGYSEDYSEQVERPKALCAETHVAFGLLCWLCHDCRKEYHRLVKDHELTRVYGRETLKLEFWKSRVGPETPEESIDEGLKLWNTVDEVERNINEFANKWLISDLDEQRTK